MQDLYLRMAGEFQDMAKEMEALWVKEMEASMQKGILSRRHNLKMAEIYNEQLQHNMKQAQYYLKRAGEVA